MTTSVNALRAECLRYKALAEGAINQLEDAELSAAGASDENSIAVICRHVSGNLRSRFTEFLTTDGEKPWRRRDEEFSPRHPTRAELLAEWEHGWSALLNTLAGLSDEQLQQTVTIRRQPLTVHEALLRALAHLSYHVGQIVYVAKSLRGKDWTFLSIPPGQSEAFNEALGGLTPDAASRLP